MHTYQTVEINQKENNMAKELKKRNLELEIKNEIAAIKARLYSGNSDYPETDEKNLQFLLSLQRMFNARVSARIAEIKSKGR